MSNPLDRISNALPEHYREDYPKFIEFIRTFYDWLYRNGGFSAEEVEQIKSEENWFVDDVQKYYATEDLRYIAKGDAHAEELAVIRASAQKPPGKAAEDFMSDYSLDRVFSYFETADGDVFDTVDDRPLEAPKRNEAFIGKWLGALSFVDPTTVSGLDSVDKILLVRVIKYFYLVKGTAKAIELFFNIFLETPVSIADGTLEIYLPKRQIAVIDDNFVLDGRNQLRDDDYWNEYTYVIRIFDPTNKAETLFNSFYKRYIHPAGFKAIVENTFNTNNEIPTPLVLLNSELRQIHTSLVFTRPTPAAYVNDFKLLTYAAPNTPRFDYTPDFGIPKGLMFESPSYNMIRFSDFFNEMSSIIMGLEAVVDNVTDVTGGVGVTNLRETVTSGLKTFEFEIEGFQKGKVYTFSIYAKANGRQQFRIENTSSQFGVNAYVDYNLQSSSVYSKATQIRAKVESYNDGWKRLFWTGVAVNDGKSSFRFTLLDHQYDPNYIGNGESGVYISDSQMEVGEGSTNIRTLSSPLPREAEIMQFVKPSDISDETGTFFIEYIQPKNTVAAATLLVLRDSVNEAKLRVNVDGGIVRIETTDGRFNQGIEVLPGERLKIAFSYAEDQEIRMTVNDLLADNVGVGSTIFDNIYVGNDITLDKSLDSYVHRVYYYPIALSEAQMLSLTTS